MNVNSDRRIIGGMSGLPEVVKCGYMHPLYAESLGESGNPRELSQCGAWILDREIPGFSYHDAMGCYPFFSCANWAALAEDIKQLEDTTALVCLSLVTDPFSNLDERYLRECFQDVLFPFKEHYVVDLTCSPESFVSKSHGRNAAKAGRSLEVSCCEKPQEHLDEWCEFYQTLIERHQIKGITAFSRMSFQKQLRVPGLIMFRAVCGPEPVGMVLFYVQNDVVYYHLGAYSEEGYRKRASFALFWFAIEYFAASGLRWLSLGAGAGVRGDGKDGLSRFKRGWSTGTRAAYFCGRIFDHAKYSEIVQAKKIGPTNYFPAYRKGEFA
ncbi:MAG: GNAT family N-acetyltransferase [Planctomycetota bacterium]